MHFYDTLRLAVAFIILDPVKQPGKVLIGKMIDDPAKTLSDEWHIPGGKMELGEDVAQATVREAKEETDIDCSFAGILDCSLSQTIMSDDSVRHRLIVWTVCTAGHVPYTEKPGSDLVELLWVDRAEAYSRCGPTAQQRMPFTTVRQFLTSHTYIPR